MNNKVELTADLANGNVNYKGNLAKHRQLHAAIVLPPAYKKSVAQQPELEKIEICSTDRNNAANDKVRNSLAKRKTQKNKKLKKLKNKKLGKQSKLNMAVVQRPSTAFQKIMNLQTHNERWPVDHMRVHNRSYFYRNIRLFGKRLMHQNTIIQNVHTGQWEMRFMHVLPFETSRDAKYAQVNKKFVQSPYDESKLNALEWSLGTVGSYREGLKLVTKAMSERDAPPKRCFGGMERPVDPATHLQTHFTVTTVSTKFAGMGIFDRMAMVYEALLDTLEVDQGNEIVIHPQLQHFGTSGPCVRALPHLRYMKEVILMITVTPHQWNPEKFDFAPEEHPFGKSRLEPTDVDPNAVVLTSRFKKLMKMKNKCKMPQQSFASRSSGLSSSSKHKNSKNRAGERDGDGDITFMDNFGIAIYASMKEERQRRKGRRIAAEQSQHKATSNNMINRLLSFITDDQSNRKGGKPTKRRRKTNNNTENENTILDRQSDKLGEKQLQDIARLSVIDEGDDSGNKSIVSGQELNLGVVDGAICDVHDESKNAIVLHTKSNKQSSQKNTKSSRPRNHDRSMAFVDNKTKVAPEVMMKDLVHAVRMAVRVLQRLYRERLRRRFLRWWFARHKAALNISRIYRGYCDRTYVAAFHEVRSEASVQLQSRWRGVLTRKWTDDYLDMRLRAVYTVQPKIRFFLFLKRQAFEIQNKGSAILIQKVLRGHFGRCAAIRFRAWHFFSKVVVPAVCRIQALARGHHDRCYLELFVRPMVRHRQQAHKAVLRMQMALRGKWGRVRYARIRAQDTAVRKMQAVTRGGMARKLARSIRLQHKRNRDATAIQRIVRGRLAKNVADELRQLKYHLTVRVPAAINMQKVYRSYAVRERARIALIRWNAAQKVVTFWRFCKAMLVFHQRWLHHLEEQRDNLAAQFQKIVRGFLGRKYAATVYRAHYGERIRAVFPLQRAWRSFKARRAMEKQRQASEDFWSENCLKETNEDADFYYAKIEKLQTRIANTQRALQIADKKLVELKWKRRELEDRVPLVEEELQSLSAEEVQQGWADALEEEWDQKTAIIDMMSEEILQLRITVKKANAMIEADTLEIEEIESNLEECCVETCEEYQIMHMRQLDRIERRMRRDYLRAVTRQGKRWRVRKGNRKKTVHRMREMEQQKEKAARPKPTVPAPIFLSMAHKRMVEHERQNLAKQAAMEKQQARRRYVAAKEAGEKNPIIPQAFDKVVATSLNVLKEFDFASTLGRRKKDPITDTSDMCLTCGRMHCICQDEEDKHRLF